MKEFDNDQTTEEQIEQTIVFDSTNSSDQSSISDFEIVGSSQNDQSDLKSFDEDLGDFPCKFGRYTIEKILGEGAMGKVYLASDTQLDRQVALKIPKINEEKAVQFLKRFYREAQSAAVLTHPNICPIFDVGEIDGHHYIAMDFIKGRPLSFYVKNKKLLTQKSCALAVRKVALALHEAHQKGVIHRDIKPANVMVNQRGEPVVMDFGLAHRQDNEGDERLTHDGTLLGSPAYMSPEQVSGSPDDVGPSSDIYSLGVMLFELLTGKIPFTGRGSITSIISDILTTEAPQITTIRSDVDPKLAAICHKAIQKKPEDRFQSMKEFASALNGYIKQTKGEVTSTDLEVAKINEKIAMVRTLCKDGDFAPAVSVLNKIIGDSSNDRRLMEWANSELPRVIAARDKAEAAKNDPLGIGGPDPLANSMHGTTLPGPFNQQQKKTNQGLLIAVSAGILFVALLGGSMIFSNWGGSSSADNNDATTNSSTSKSKSNVESNDRGTTTESKKSAESKSESNSETVAPAPKVFEKGKKNKPSKSEVDNVFPLTIAEVFNRFDRNQDRVLEFDEIPAEDLEFVRQADTDNDEVLSRLELKSFAKKVAAEKIDVPASLFLPPPGPDGQPEELRRLLQIHDVNQDGFISEEEAPPFMRRNFDRLDSNADGKLSQNELKNARGPQRPKRRGRGIFDDR